jgi:hypothetical protein
LGYLVSGCVRRVYVELRICFILLSESVDLEHTPNIEFVWSPDGGRFTCLCPRHADLPERQLQLHNGGTSYNSVGMQLGLLGAW